MTTMPMTRCGHDDAVVAMTMRLGGRTRYSIDAAW